MHTNNQNLTSKIDLSIIIVCFNSEKTIRRCIESIINQICLPAEIIIIDGNSTDKTLEIISDYKDLITIMVSEKDDGIYHAMNKGITLVNSSFFMFVNSDDYFKDSECLTKYRESLTNKKIDILFPNIIYVDNGKITRKWDFCEVDCESYLATRIPHPGTAVRKTFANKVGLFNTNFKVAADFDYFLRLLLHKAKYKHINSYIINMEVGGASDGNILDFAKQNIEILRSLKINGYGFFHMFIFFFDRINFKLKQKL